MPVVCLKSCNYCATASEHCTIVLLEFQCWSATAFAGRGEADGQVFLCIVAGELFFLSLSWRQSYVRGESLPTAPLCFCFSQWANVSLPRPHSLSGRPLSWKHSLAEATQGQACEVGGGGGGGGEGGSSSKSHDGRPYTTVPALHEAQMLWAHFAS